MSDIRVEETFLKAERNGQSLHTDDLPPLPSRAADSGGRPVNLRPDLATFETTMMMDRSALNRPERTLRPEEFSGVPSDGEEIASPRMPSSPVISLETEKTPAEFSHLYASLERQIAGVGDVTLISGETLGAERPYVLGITSAVMGEGENDGCPASGDDHCP